MNEVAKRVNQMKDAAASGQGSTRHVLGSILSATNERTIQAMPKKATLERGIWRAREHNQPEVDLEIKEIILYDSGADDIDRIIIFGHPTVIAKLVSDVWFVDGTFSVALDGFAQLYSIHAEVRNAYPACIYALLPSKSAVTYARMITLIKEIVPGASPSKILLDFEMAAIQAFRAAFPETLIISASSICHNQ